MKQTILLTILSAMSFAACNNASREANKTTDTTVQVLTQPNAVATNKFTDPVCGMVKDSTWTDYVVGKNDTTWFCSGTDKDAYLGNPKKYKKRS